MFGLSYIAIDRGRNKVGKNLLQRKHTTKRNRGRPGVNELLAGRIPRSVRRQAPLSAVCRPQCSRLLKPPGRA